MTEFEKKVAALRAHHEALLSLKNEPMEWGCPALPFCYAENGIYEKYKNPVVTASGTVSIVWWSVWRVLTERVSLLWQSRLMVSIIFVSGRNPLPCPMT